MSIRHAFVFAALVLSAAACSKDKDASAAPPAVAAATSAPKPGHAPSGVVPGSHEDWCTEHAVPESQCTRCSPDLVPAFKATGDWCPEHGLPESQCLKCNPKLQITRPPKTGG